MNRGWTSAIVLCMTSGAVAEPVQWRVADGGNGHWYEGVVMATDQTTTTAQAVAQARGGHLVTISSAEESAFTLDLSEQAGLWMSSKVGPIIGLVVNETECVAGCWVTGEPVVYTNWHPENPDFPESDHCVMLWEHSGRWQNYDCDRGWGGFHPRTALFEWDADCNGDGIVDLGQILAGDLPDANQNGVPDGVVIQTQPVDQTVASGVPVTFFVEASPLPGCDTPITYQWQRRDPAVIDPDAPNAWGDITDGGAFLNSRTAAFVITRPSQGLATGYRCRLGGGCGCDPGGGPVYTREVNFTLACPTDFNGDGFVDFFDYDAFVEAFETGC